MPEAPCPAYAQLANIIYYHTQADIMKAVEKLPGWSCSWGPKMSTDDINAAMVAQQHDAKGKLKSLAVVLRGTDPLNPGGIFQISEDIKITKQVAYPFAMDKKVKIAHGTATALKHVMGLEQHGENIADHLIRVLKEEKHPEKITIGVTGHSLGGCLTTVVAPWLHSKLKEANLKSPIQPCSFAGPTAGNAHFADYYKALFPNALRVCNSLDIAPMAYAPDSLLKMETVYEPKIPMPRTTRFIVERIRKAQLKSNPKYCYQQPGDPWLLKGKIAASHHWDLQGLAQHHMTTYLSLMGLEPVE